VSEAAVTPAIAAQGFFEQAKSLRHAPSLLRQAAAGNGAPHVFEQRIGGAGDGFGPGQCDYKLRLQ
jgi:hypothetical protein